MDRQPAVIWDRGVVHTMQRGERPLQKHLVAASEREAVAQRVGREFGRNREQDEDRD